MIVDHRPTCRRPAGPCVVVAALTATALGQTIALPDQEFDPQFTNTSVLVGDPPFVNQEQEVAQTFTPGVTGQLTGVDVKVKGSAGLIVSGADLEVDILGTSGGLPRDNRLLGTAIFDSADLPFGAIEFVHVDFSSLDVNLIAGKLYALALRSPLLGSDLHYEWFGLSTGGYGGGEAAGRVLPNPWGVGPNNTLDMAFRTFMAPEPGTIVLMLTGTLIVGRRHRRPR